MATLFKQLSILLIFVTACAGCNSETFFTENFDAEISLTEIQSWQISNTELLPNPRNAGFLNDGSLVVIDGALNTINHFDEFGEIINIYGGEGRGPGEYQTIVDAHISPNGKVAIADLSNTKISLLNLAEDSIVTTDFVSGWNTRVRIVDGGVAVVNHPFRFMSEFPGDLQLSFFNTDTKQKEEFLHLELEQNETPPGQVSCTFCDFRFLDDLSFYTSPRDTSYFLYHVDKEGEIITTFSRSNLEPLLYTAEERENLREQMAGAMQMIGQGDDEYVPPTHKRRVAFWYPDHQNRLWVLVNSEEGRQRHFDIFSPDGSYIGSLDIPDADFTLEHLESDRLLFTRISDDYETWEAKLFRIDG